MLRPYFRRVLPRPHPRDPLTVNQYRSVGEYLDVRHFSPPARARRAATRHDLPRADQQRFQSRS
ncbi:MAG TPA: hypothetical protein VK113_03490 [Gemmatimonadales bacterium]|nr:hypothetical protein [Gemmatimonadales bacterium]